MSEAAVAEAPSEAQAPKLWEGPLALIGKPTDDGRYLMEADHRELPLSLMAQVETADGHMGAKLAARIDEIWNVNGKDGETGDPNVTEIWGRGPFDSSEFGQEVARLVDEKFLTGVSIDFAVSESMLLDPKTFEPIDTEQMDIADLLDGDYLTGLKGTIMGATLVPFPAFADTRVSVVTASAGHVLDLEAVDLKERFRALVAAGGPLKPPYDWFKDPYLSELTPLTITKEGRVYGHLADWDGCHTGFQGVCVPPFRSMSDYAFFNVGEIETAEGELVPCGKLMFCMEGNGHAPIDEYLGYEEIQRYYDDATKVGAFVRAGSDRYGTWLAGALRPGLTDEEIQHLRTHPPSGDWRPIKGGPSDLVAAFSVPIPGFPIARGRALVASAGGSITAIISAPLELEDEAMGARARMRKKAMLGFRLREALGHPMTRAEMRAASVDGFADITSEQRRKWAKSGVAMPDGSYPVTKCTGDGTSAENARRAIGRAPASKRDAVKAHITKREKALGCSASDEDKSG